MRRIERKKRLVAVTSHPVWYRLPRCRELVRGPEFDAEVSCCGDSSIGVGHGENVPWKIDPLSGPQ